jgi:phosphoserine phosphatase
MAESLLVTVSGPDRPGVTADLFAAVSGMPVTVADVEQVVIRGRLVLGILLTGTDLSAPGRALAETAERLGLVAVLETGAAADDARRRDRVLVTVLGSPLVPAGLAGVAQTIAVEHGNIDRISRLARYPVTGIELEVSGADPMRLREALNRRARELGVDIAVQPGGLARRGTRLVVLDVDSTLIQQEVIELLAAEAGCEAEVARITESAMAGDLDFAESLTARVGLLAGLSQQSVERARSRVRLAPGAKTFVRTLKRLGYSVGIVSGGFTAVTDDLADTLGLDFAAANVLEVVDGRLTGRLVGPIIDRPGKAAALRQFADQVGVPLAQTVAIGDGANDLDMLGAAGLGIAFNAKPVVRSAADAAVSVPYLDAVLYLLGITREEIEAADAADGTPTPAPPLPG